MISSPSSYRKSCPGSLNVPSRWAELRGTHHTEAHGQGQRTISLTPRWFQKPSGGVARTHLFCSVGNGGFCAFRKALVLESGPPQLPQPTIEGNSWRQKGIRQERQDSVPGYSKKRPKISYRRCLNRLYEAFLFAGAQPLVSLTWPRSMQRNRVPQCQLLTRAIHRGGP
jgi:hypothetical protein